MAAWTAPSSNSRIASKAERRLTYTEPPYYPRPVAEPWGHAALRANKQVEADRAFAIALAQYPNDAHANSQEPSRKAAAAGER